jgi:hypothetical protein
LVVVVSIYEKFSIIAIKLDHLVKLVSFSRLMSHLFIDIYYDIFNNSVFFACHIIMCSSIFASSQITTMCDVVYVNYVMFLFGSSASESSNAW